MDGGTWWAAVHGVAEESDTTERLHLHFSLSCIGEGNGNPLQCSCLENPRDGGAWWAAVYGVTQSWTWLKRLSSSILRLSPCSICKHLFGTLVWFFQLRLAKMQFLGETDTMSLKLYRFLAFDLFLWKILFSGNCLKKLLAWLFWDQAILLVCLALAGIRLASCLNWAASCSSCLKIVLLAGQ